VNLICGHPIRLATSEARHLRSLVRVADCSSGASTRVKPNRALTSRSRSSNSTLAIRLSKPGGVPDLLAHECG
jgi:hypothetical protein